MAVQRYPGLPQILSTLRLQIHEVGEVDLGPEWDHRGVCSPFHRLYFVAGGDGFVTTQKTRAELKKGSVWFLPAGMTADYRCRSRVRKGYLSLNVEWLPGLDLFVGVQEPASLGTWEAHGESVWPWPGRPGQRTFTLAMTAGIWQRLAILPHPSPAKSLPGSESVDRMEPVLAYLDENLSAGLTVAAMAKRAAMTPGTFTREFTRILGRTPKDFLGERLYHRAATLLLAQELPVRVLATQLGFDDEFYFSRWFRRHSGLSPTAFRKQSMTGVLPGES